MLVIKAKCDDIFLPHVVGVLFVPHRARAKAWAIHVTIVIVAAAVIPSSMTVVRIVLWAAHVTATVPSHRLVHVLLLIEVVLNVLVEFDSTELDVGMRQVGVVLALATSTIMLLLLVHWSHVLLMLMLLPLISILLKVVILRWVVITALAAAEILLLIILLLLARRHRPTR